MQQDKLTCKKRSHLIKHNQTAFSSTGKHVKDEVAECDANMKISGRKFALLVKNQLIKH